MSNTQIAIDLLHVLEKTEAQRDELLSALEDVNEFLNFAWRDIQMNDDSFTLLEDIIGKVQIQIAKAKGEQ